MILSGQPAVLNAEKGIAPKQDEAKSAFSPEPDLTWDRYEASFIIGMGCEEPVWSLNPLLI